MSAAVERRHWHFTGSALLTPVMTFFARPALELAKYDVRISSPPGGFLAFILALSGSTHLFMRAVKFNMQ